MDQSVAIEKLNNILQGEISAVETYEQALTKVSATDAPKIENFLQDHREAVARLSEQVRALGGQPAESSGAWGAFAKTVEGSAKIFGEKSALKALKEGEEHGRKDYEDALNMPEIDETYKTVIRTELLPKTESHIQSLDSYMQ